jgi:hypothetical protein
MDSSNLNNLNNPNHAAVSREGDQADLRSWVIVLAIAVSFLTWGLVIFLTVGVSWPPPWRYGTVADVPGQSIYRLLSATAGSRL